MTTTIKKVNWESTNGSKVEVEIEITKEIVEQIIDADGDKINIGSKIETSKEITIKVNGKYITTTSRNPTIVTEKTCSDYLVKQAKETNSYAVIGDNILINEENYNLIIVAITEAELEVATDFEKENTEIVAKVKKDKQIKEEKENTAKKEWANKVIEESEIREILSREDEKKWQRDYNKFYNEGGEGYIPRRTTLEDLEKAKSILA